MSIPKIFFLRLKAETQVLRRNWVVVFSELQPYLGYKHAAQSHGGTEADTEAHGDNFVVGPKVDGYKGQPDNTGGVHGEGNVLSLIEISWDVAGLEERDKRKRGRQSVSNIQAFSICCRFFFCVFNHKLLQVLNHEQKEEKKL